MKRADLKAALENLNVSAFLKAIRLGEGTTDEAGYYRIVGGGTFTDDSTHPHISVFIPKYKFYSTAAGAYQIIFRTWKGLCKQYGFTGFTPEEQDEMAVALIAGRHALAPLLDGAFKDAVGLCSAEWASLPGSTAGQRTEAFDAVLAVYQQNGGTVA
jgi:muramidase (phage lysozyme)